MREATAMTRPKLKSLGVATVGVGLLVAAWAAARPQTLPGPPPGNAKAPDLQFKEDGDDLVVHHMIEGPAARQVVVADYTVYDGRAASGTEGSLARRLVELLPAGVGRRLLAFEGVEPCLRLGDLGLIAAVEGGVGHRRLQVAQ